MKIIKYKILSCTINTGTEADPSYEDVLLDVKIMCETQKQLDANLPMVEKNAYNGEYTIEDDGQPEPEPKQTPEERIAELEEALALLLSGVTE